MFAILPAEASLRCGEKETSMAMILIVEDDPSINQLLADLLKADGHTLLQALDGKAGVGMTRQERPDLVVMDLRLPTVDGADAIRILKGDPKTRDIPIIVVSASFTLRAEAGTLPVDATISKPLGIDEVLAEVAVQLHRAAGAQRTAPSPSSAS
jgi:DNA-binding response OmpR family regulator